MAFALLPELHAGSVDLANSSLEATVLVSSLVKNYRLHLVIVDVAFVVKDALVNVGVDYSESKGNNSLYA